jgi:cytochrome P450
MAYGYTVEPHEPDALVELIEKMMTEFSLAASPMTWAVDIIPALQYLPEGFPGASFKQTAHRWRRSIQASAQIPYDFVRRQMSALVNRPSYVSKLVKQLAREGETDALSGEDEQAILWTAASLYGAAADTTVITLTTFTLAMVLFPEVQRKAQVEVDRVVGTDRIPSFEDRDDLPYVSALVKEASRWWPITPMSFPHTVTQEFEYQGYRLPKDAIVMPSVYWFLRDPAVYHDPDRFDPDRFLPPRNEPDPVTEAFGYGRRVCPGRFFADSSLYINIVQTLATFNLGKAVGDDGREIEVNARPKPGVLTYPTDFRFRATPRSQKHIELIRELERKHPFQPSDAALLQNPGVFEERR